MEAKHKLEKLLDNAELADLLAAGGYDSPQAIKAATNRELLAVEGIGQARLNEIRERFPRIQ